MTFVKTAFILTATLSSIYAVAAFIGQLETDCYIAVLVATLALGGVVVIDHLEAEHDRRIRDERARQWARRDREADA
ncbi:hypothetical protein PJN38_24375 [Mycobacterium kansasii]|uniref:hypothetical protein n=1 Tax=Mycobacterium kansasii TaxID=1768 RepID=UPI0012EC9470|nr:hypothetical protein [Mycobacterium kansasii]